MGDNFGERFEICFGIIYNTAMKKYKVVLDTNVIVSALKSKKGFSYKLLSVIDDDRIEVNISVPLIIEYEDVLKRKKSKIGLSTKDIEAVLDYLCLIGQKREIFYLWRPYLKDIKDDMLLELAVESECTMIITFNKNDFAGIERFGIDTFTPKEFLELLGKKK